jgi:hypothetical protein
MDEKESYDAHVEAWEEEQEWEKYRDDYEYDDYDYEEEKPRWVVVWRREEDGSKSVVRVLDGDDHSEPDHDLAEGELWDYVYKEDAADELEVFAKRDELLW